MIAKLVFILCNMYFYKSSSKALYSTLLNRTQMNKLLLHIRNLNNYDIVSNTQNLIPFEINNEIYGYVNTKFYECLQKYPKIFDTYQNNQIKKLKFTNYIENELSMSEKTNELNKVNLDLSNQGIIVGWRNELLPISSSYSTEPRLLIERAACPYYGIKAYGVHINGFVCNDKHQITSLWVAKRSPSKSTWPNMLDHIAAGGQPYGINVVDNVMKECKEEANIDEDIARNAISCGAVSYNTLDSYNNLKRDALFCFDLELPCTFQPQPIDGEVESFQLQSIEWVLDKVIEGGEFGYKPNCNLVLIDFFIRHGVIHPESPHYLELVGELRGSFCS